LGASDFGNDALEWQRRIVGRAATTNSTFGSSFTSTGGLPPAVSTIMNQEEMVNDEVDRVGVNRSESTTSSHQVEDQRQPEKNESGGRIVSLEERRKFWKDRARESIENARRVHFPSLPLKCLVFFISD
jgi:hypothetical protein